jgi:hypothetical protein
MRVLFCGGRHFDDTRRVRAAFDALRPTFVITGGATGADTLADNVAAARGVPRVVYPANWEGDGKAAGPIRNARMLSEGRPDLVVAFYGGRGPADLETKAKAAGVHVESR